MAAACVLLAAAAGATIAVRAQSATSGWVAHTYQVITELEGTLSTITEAEATQRAFLLTGDPVQAARYVRLAPRIEASLDRLAKLTADNPLQQSRVGGLREAVARRIDRLHEVAQWRRDHADAPIGMSQLQAGARQMADVHARVAELRLEEERLLERRLADAVRASWLGVAATLGTGVLAVLAIAVLHVASGRHADLIERANRRLADQASELETTVHRRTAELRDANEVLDGFAHTVAHDLRAPLRNIAGFAGALLEDESPRLSDSGVVYARRLADAAARMDRLITDLLAYSRVARADLPLQPVALEGLVARALEELASDVATTGAEVRVDPDMSIVVAHPEALAQVLSNLLGNALKFSRPGVPPVVQVRARRAGARVQVDIEDNGIGIAAQHQDRIFSVFQRVHGQDTYPGSGVGLAIVRKLVERTGGTVTVRSSPGEGSTFTLDLPAAPDDASSAAR